MALFKRNKDKGKRLADGSGDERPVDKPKKKRPASEFEFAIVTWSLANSSASCLPPTVSCFRVFGACMQSTCDTSSPNLCLVSMIPTPRLLSSYTHFRTYKPPLPIHPFPILTALLPVVPLLPHTFANSLHPSRPTLLDTAFKQQRLKAWQPILTPKSVLPTLFLIGLLFAPIGAVLVWGSGTVTSFKIDYTDCDLDAPGDGSAANMPKSKFDCECAESGVWGLGPRLRGDLLGSGGLMIKSSRVLSVSISAPAIPSSDKLSTSRSGYSYNDPTWSFTNDTSRAFGQQAQCVVRFVVPYDLGECNYHLHFGLR